MKKFVIATMIAACIALCAAVWPHGNAVEETPVPAAGTAVKKVRIFTKTATKSGAWVEICGEHSK